MLCRRAVALVALATCIVTSVAHAQALPAYDGNCQACTDDVDGHYCIHDGTCWADVTCGTSSCLAASCYAEEDQCPGDHSDSATTVGIVVAVVLIVGAVGVVVYCCRKRNQPVVVAGAPQYRSHFSAGGSPTRQGMYTQMFPVNGASSQHTNATPSAASAQVLYGTTSTGYEARGAPATDMEEKQAAPLPPTDSELARGYDE